MASSNSASQIVPVVRQTGRTRQPLLIHYIYTNHHPYHIRFNPIAAGRGQAEEPWHLTEDPRGA